GAGDGRRRSPAVSPCRPAGRAALYRHRVAARPRPRPAHSGRGLDTRRRAMGAGVADFPRARIPPYRRDACLARPDLAARARPREARFSAAGNLHCRALGYDDMMPVRDLSERSISLRRGALTLVIAAALYEALARSGYFPPALTPTLGAVAHTLFASLA